MRSFLRSWRVWWLALALAAAPQLSFVHALSHLSASGVAQPGDDERQQAPDKVCDLCLSLAHLGHALAAQPSWAPVATTFDTPGALPVAAATQRPPAYFRARAPPITL